MVDQAFENAFVRHHQQASVALRSRNVLERRQGEGDRVGQREGQALREQGTELRHQKEEPEDEQDVIDALGQLGI